MLDTVGVVDRAPHASSAAASTAQANRIATLRFFMMHLLFCRTACSRASAIIAEAVLSIRYFDVDALVDGALALVVRNADAANFGRVVHMRAAIRLQVEPHDLHRANFLD